LNHVIKFVVNKFQCTHTHIPCTHAHMYTRTRTHTQGLALKYRKWSYVRAQYNVFRQRWSNNGLTIISGSAMLCSRLQMQKNLSTFSFQIVQINICMNLFLWFCGSIHHHSLSDTYFLNLLLARLEKQPFVGILVSTTGIYTNLIPVTT